MSSKTALQKKITIVIPLRISNQLYEAEERLKKIIEYVPTNLFNILVVDYGTKKEFLNVLDIIKNNINVTVIRYEYENRPFSIGHARDLGVQHSKDSIVMFQDIDFLCSKNMYKKIFAEAEFRNMGVNINDFFCVPVVFLNENGSTQSRALIKKGLDSYLHNLIFLEQPSFKEFIAFGSSAIVVNKYHYLSIGGHDKQFYGHGAEDYELLHRLASERPKGPRTKDYYTDTKSNLIAEYIGFRAFFSIYGIDVFCRGVFFIHLWHPKRLIQDYQQSARNFKLLRKLMEEFDKNKNHPSPLPDNNNSINTLLLIESKSLAFEALRKVTPYLGSFEYQSEYNFTDSQCLIDYCLKNKINYVIFLNPYGNDHRLSLYKAIKNSSIRYFVFDRGSLPDSWFFDPNGFNFDSSSYSEENWDRVLSDEEVANIENYKYQLVNGDESLEECGIRKGAFYYRDKLGIGRRKVIFVPFQRPTDTVTIYFAGSCKSVEGFQEIVKTTIEKLPKSEWVVVCKNHPLDTDLQKIEGALYVPDDSHINDLIDMADVVLLMNSGVGVLSLAFEKPVICISEAFYCHPGIAKSANSVDEIIESLNKIECPDKNKINAFLFHLKENVYSFGKATYKNTLASDGSKRKIVNRIEFYSIKLPGLIGRHNISRITNGVSLDAPLFWSFGSRKNIKNILNLALNNPIILNKKVKVKEQTNQNSILNTFILMRKFRKLIRSPRLFFRDAIRKVLEK